MPQKNNNCAHAQLRLATIISTGERGWVKHNAVKSLAAVLSHFCVSPLSGKTQNLTVVLQAEIAEDSQDRQFFKAWTEVRQEHFNAEFTANNPVLHDGHGRLLCPGSDKGTGAADDMVDGTADEEDGDAADTADSDAEEDDGDAALAADSDADEEDSDANDQSNGDSNTTDSEQTLESTHQPDDSPTCGMFYLGTPPDRGKDLPINLLSTQASANFYATAAPGVVCGVFGSAASADANPMDKARAAGRRAAATMSFACAALSITGCAVNHLWQSRVFASLCADDSDQINNNLETQTTCKPRICADNFDPQNTCLHVGCLVKTHLDTEHCALCVPNSTDECNECTKRVEFCGHLLQPEAATLSECNSLASLGTRCVVVTTLKKQLTAFYDSSASEAHFRHILAAGNSVMEFTVPGGAFKGEPCYIFVCTYWLIQLGTADLQQLWEGNGIMGDILLGN